MFEIAIKKKSEIESHSEWNMTQYDFKRIDEIFYDIDENYSKASKGKNKYISFYLISLKAFYRYLRPLLKTSQQKNYDKEFVILKKLVNNKIKLDKIETLHDNLMQKRQLLGMGIFASRNKPIAEKHLKVDI